MNLTAKQLEDVAWALDMLAKVSRCLLEPVAAMDEINAESLSVEVEVTRDGEPLLPADARTLLEWLDGDEMQRDLRAEAVRVSGEGE